MRSHAVTEFPPFSAFLPFTALGGTLQKRWMMEMKCIGWEIRYLIPERGDFYAARGVRGALTWQTSGCSAVRG